MTESARISHICTINLQVTKLIYMRKLYALQHGPSCMFLFTCYLLFVRHLHIHISAALEW